MTPADKTGGGAPPQSHGLPLVAEDGGNRPLWIALALIGLAGTVLFVSLETRRAALSAPAIRPRANDQDFSRSNVPELFVPAEPVRLTSWRPRQIPVNIQSVPRRSIDTSNQPQREPKTPRAPENLSGSSNPYQGQPGASPPPQYGPPARSADTSPAIVFDGGRTTNGEGSTANAGGSASASGGTAIVRAQAARSIPHDLIIAQGTLIPAVLETAIDSTQPGKVRALVTDNVLSIRGANILIPKGSRLFGEYRGELGAGQKRANVQWTRLVRPDGVTVDLDSAASDRLGRAGIGGKVDTHFMERLGGALLQSTIDIGTGVLTRRLSNSTIVVALPSSVQGATSQLVPQAPKPTLRVRQGTSISVYVARDLDFSGVETVE
jgi:type IV secretion system protein VirB10